MTPVIASLILVSGCRSASVNSSSGNNSVPGATGSPSFFRSYPFSGHSIDDDENQVPTPQSVPPTPLPDPGYTEPEIPPAPTAQKSKWNFKSSHFKLPTIGRQSADVKQMGAKNDESGFASKFKTNPSGSPTLREDENNESTSEIVSPRTSDVKSHSSASPLAVDDLHIPDHYRVDDSDAVKSRYRPPTAPTRSRYHVIKQWPDSRTKSDSSSKSASPSDTNSDLPELTVPGASGAEGGVPRLLPAEE